MSTTADSLREIFLNKKVALFILFQAVWTGFILLFFEYFQPIIRIAGIPLIYFGIVYALARLFEGLGSALIHRFEHHSNRRLLFANILMLLIALFGFAFTHSYLLILFIMIGCAADGIADVVQSEVLNNNISSKNRTTIMSAANVANAIFTSILLFSFGHIGDVVGVQKMFGLAGFAFAIGLAILLAVTRNRIILKQKPQRVGHLFWSG